MTQDPKKRRGIDEEAMMVQYPKAYAYLKRFESVLEARKTKAVRHLMERGAFYSIFGVGNYTFAPWKVVWREVGHEIDASVVDMAYVDKSRKAIVPDHTCVAVPCEKKDEAHYVCALLNSSPVRLAIRNYIVLYPDPHVLKNVRLPKFSEKNRIHVKLSEISIAAHRAASAGDVEEVKRLEGKIDLWAAKLWDLLTVS
jgi:hypothetical protein